MKKSLKELLKADPPVIGTRNLRGLGTESAPVKLKRQPTETQLKNIIRDETRTKRDRVREMFEMPPVAGEGIYVNLGKTREVKHLDKLKRGFRKGLFRIKSKPPKLQHMKTDYKINVGRETEEEESQPRKELVKASPPFIPPDPRLISKKPLDLKSGVGGDPARQKFVDLGLQDQPGIPLNTPGVSGRSAPDFDPASGPQRQNYQTGSFRNPTARRTDISPTQEAVGRRKTEPSAPYPLTEFRSITSGVPEGYPARSQGRFGQDPRGEALFQINRGDTRYHPPASFRKVGKYTKGKEPWTSSTAARVDQLEHVWKLRPSDSVFPKEEVQRFYQEKHPFSRGNFPWSKWDEKEVGYKQPVSETFNEWAKKFPRAFKQLQQNPTGKLWLKHHNLMPTTTNTANQSGRMSKSDTLWFAAIDTLYDISKGSPPTKRKYSKKEFSAPKWKNLTFTQTDDEKLKSPFTPPEEKSKITSLKDAESGFAFEDSPPKV